MSSGRTGGPGDERFDVPGAEILFQDTWSSEKPENCPACGAKVDSTSLRCEACGQWLARCQGTCLSCGSPRCVGNRRAR